jgi:hypothetical protein
METSVVAPNFIEARSGTFVLDQPGDLGGINRTSFEDLGIHAEWVEGVHDPIEWSNCHYESSTCIETMRYDDSGSGDARLRGIPLIVRPVGDTTRGGAERAARAFFDEPRGALLPGDYLGSYLRYAAEGGELSELGGAHSATLDVITTYFRRNLSVGYDSGHGCADGCTCEERPLACIGAYEDEFDVRSTYPANRFHVEAPGGGLRPADFLNGLELTCMAARIQSDSPEFGCSEPPRIDSINDLLQADAFLRCSAENIESRAGATVISDLPGRISEQVGESGPGALGRDSGEIASQVNALNGAFSELSDARYAIADNIRQMANQIRILRGEVAKSEIAHQIEDLSLQSTVWNQVTSCVTAVATVPSTDAATAAGRGIAAAATCINSIAQISLASQISGLRHESLEEGLRIRFAQFDTQVNQATAAMRQSATSLETQLSSIDSALSRINGIRDEGRRALARALYLETDGADAHSAVSSGYRARYNTLLTRYTAAHERAVRAAFIARRAVEQRLAMPLETITDDLPTVEAPAEWADEVCTLPSINYEELRGAPGMDGEDPAPLGPEGYSGSYVGDYVERLGQVVESYNFVFPFQDGTDTAVISLRDDVFSVRRPCEVETPNLLYYAESLDVLGRDGDPGWERSGCEPIESTPPPEPVEPGDLPPSPPAVVDAHCVSARPLTPDEDPAYFEAEGGGVDLGLPQGYRVRFGGSEAATVDTSLVQRVVVPEGRYRLSWYGRAVGGSAVDPAQAVAAFGEDGTRLDDTRRWSERLGTWPALSDWYRFHTFVDVPSGQEISISLRPDWTVPSEQFVDLGGIMLEDVTRTVLGDPGRMVSDPAGSGTVPLAEVEGPRPFFATGSTRTRVLSSCIDHTGERFRAEAWTYGCTRVCPDGYDAECDDRVAGTRCYHQTSVPIDSDFVGRMLTDTPAGFAAGNYNYRIESVAVNVVGTGIRVCDGSPGCFGSGNVAYSLLHVGPYPVRNARGEAYSAPLFPGRMESARALAAERYITNPISSADQSLLGPYLRSDFSGRPLGGTLVLRIWDEPSVAFERVEDIQLVLDYRYWQRQR